MCAVCQQGVLGLSSAGARCVGSSHRHFVSSPTALCALQTEGALGFANFFSKMHNDYFDLGFEAKHVPSDKINRLINGSFAFKLSKVSIFLDFGCICTIFAQQCVKHDILGQLELKRTEISSRNHIESTRNRSCKKSHDL